MRKVISFRLHIGEFLALLMNSKAAFACLLFAAVSQVNAENPCEGRHFEFVNDYASCSRYFSCVNGVAHPVECPDGRWFRADPPACVAAGSIPCTVCPSTGVVTIGVPNSCTEYTLCINGNAMERECAPGTLFDWRLGQCDLKEVVTCDYLLCPDTGLVLVADPTSCEHYLVCDEGEKLARRQCANGLRFDPVLGSCSRNENIPCPLHAGFFSAAKSIDMFGIPTVPTAVPLPPRDPVETPEEPPQPDQPELPQIPTAPTGPTSTLAPTTTPAATTTPVPTTTRVGITGTRAPPGNIVRQWPSAPVTCPGTGIYYFGHHLTCTVFQVCNNGVLHIVSCPTPQHWSTVHGTCEFPERSNCPH